MKRKSITIIALFVAFFPVNSLLLIAEDEFPDSNSFKQINTGQEIQNIPSPPPKYNKNDQFPGDQEYPQMNGIRPQPEPQFPGSDSFGNIKYNYPKGILPSVPTKKTNQGYYFVNTLGNSNPNSFPEADNYRQSQTFTQFKKGKQFETFSPRKVQFPSSNEFKGSGYKPWMYMQNDIEVNAGGYESQYYIEQKKQIKENLEKKQKEAMKKKEEQYKKMKEKEKELEEETALPPDKGIIQNLKFRIRISILHKLTSATSP